MTYDAQTRFGELFQGWVEARCFIDGEDNERSPARIRIRIGSGRSWTQAAQVDVSDSDTTWSRVLEALDDAVPPTMATGVRLELLDQGGRQLSCRQRQVDADDSHDYGGGQLAGDSLEGAHGVVVGVLAGLVRDLSAGHVQTNRELVRRAHNAEEQVRQLYHRIVHQEIDHAQDEAASMVVASQNDRRDQLISYGLQLVGPALMGAMAGKGASSPTPGTSESTDAGEPDTETLKRWAVGNPMGVLSLLMELPPEVRQQLGAQLQAAE